MSHTTVAVQTIGFLVVIFISAIHGLHHRLMAVQAGIFNDLQAVFFDQDGFVKVLKGEGHGMIPAIQSFHGVFADDVVGQMAVVAFSDVVMGGLLPGIQVFAHDVAVHTGLGIVRQVRISLRIDERVAAQTDDNTEKNQDKQVEFAEVGHKRIINYFAVFR